MNLSISQILQKVKKSFGKDVFFTLANSLWKIISGPVTLLLIPLFISPIIQGYWYTFISLAALSILADLGFTTIVSQFSAHEYAHLRVNEKTKRLEGNAQHLKRIQSLFRFVLRWAIKVSIFGFPLIFFIGVFLFSKKNDAVSWLIPWVLFVCVSGINFTTNVILSFLEGCNQIANIQKNKIISAITSSICIWVFLYSGFNLYALSITLIIGTLVNIGLILMKFRKMLYQLYSKNKDFYVNWKRDFLRLLWRYAISWSSGYLIFQIYTPLTFQFHGAIDAGKVGISLALSTAIFTIANVWIYVSTPKINMHASRKEWKQMDKVLIRGLILSTITFLIGLLITMCSIYFFQQKIHFLKRFLNFTPMLMLLLSWFFQLIINGLAIYLRAHKQEPLVLVSVITAAFTSISSYFIIRYLNVDYIFLGFLIAVMTGLPAVYYIFQKKKKEWHTV